MSMIETTLHDHVAVVTMNHGENRFSYEFMDAFHAALDHLEQKTDARVLVVASSHEKIWSNGIDLEWLAPRVMADPEEARTFPTRLTALYQRLLLFPMITIAAIGGHAFAGGAIMACAFDFRFMRTGRGFFCIPEVDIGIPLMPSMAALFEKAVPMYKFLEMQFTGLRLTAEEGQTHHVIHQACPPEQLMSEVMAFAQKHKKERAILRTMKNVTFKEIVRVRDEDDPVYLAGGGTGLGG